MLIMVSKGKQSNTADIKFTDGFKYDKQMASQISADDKNCLSFKVKIHKTAEPSGINKCQMQHERVDTSGRARINSL